MIVAINPPSEDATEGGGSAAPERGKPRRLLVQSRAPKKSFVFLLEEKIQRAQIRKSEQNFSLGWRACRAAAGLASLLGVLLEIVSNFVQYTPPKLSI